MWPQKYMFPAQRSREASEVRLEDRNVRLYVTVLTTEHIVTDLINALPGKGSVNTNRGSNRRKTVFSMRSAPSRSTGTDRKSVSRQHSGKHASTTMGDGVLRWVRTKELS
jgi:uncharacterized membrane-anchored protein